MSFPPVQGSSAAASRREVPTFGLPEEECSPREPWELGSLCPRPQVKLKLQPIRPLPLLLVIGAPLGKIAGAAAIVARRPTTPFRVQRPEFVRQMVVEEGGRDEELPPGHRQSR